jgi:hypothetical protein
MATPAPEALAPTVQLPCDRLDGNGLPVSAFSRTAVCPWGRASARSAALPSAAEEPSRVRLLRLRPDGRVALVRPTVLATFLDLLHVARFWGHCKGPSANEGEGTTSRSSPSTATRGTMSFASSALQALSSA